MQWIFKPFCIIVLFAALAAQVVLAADKFPASLPLPDGWLPEGIVAGRGPVIYSGSRANGAIYAVDPRTGENNILVPGQVGRVALGLDFDRRSNYIFVAGGPTGTAFVYEGGTGVEVASFQLTSATPTFVNDVIVTRDAAYFTDSSQPALYRLPLGPGGKLVPDATIETIPLSGEYEHVAGLNANGIEASPNGDALIIVHSTLGVLYEVDPLTGIATLIDLGGASVSNGDGLLREGHTLYVVRNRLNTIEVIDLDADLSSGVVVDSITSPLFDVPTTITRFGSALYVVNARFTTPPTPSTPYNIVRVPSH